MLVLMVLLNVISYLIYRNGFEELERQTVEKNVTQVTQALSASLDALATLSYDWAVWDDTYQFAQKYNQDYVDRNFQNETFTSSKISFASIFNSSGEIVYSKAVDLVDSQEIQLPDDLADNLKAEGLAAPAETGEIITGTIVITGQPMMVVSRPILTSLGEGPSAGAMIFGRFIDAAIIYHLSETTHLAVNLLPIPATSADDANSEVNRVIASLDKSGPTFVQAQDSDIIAGYTYVKDLKGNPTFVFKVVVPRDIHHQETKAVMLLHTLLISIGITFFIIFMLLIRNVILSRLTRLSKNVNEIGSSGDVARRVIMPGSDELSGLANSINEMLTSVENTNSALRESEEKFSRAFQASPDAIAINKLSDGAFVEINDNFTRIFGFTREEVVGQNADQFNMWVDAEQRENMLRKVQEHTKIHNEEMVFRAKSGELHTALVSTEYIHLGGEPCLLVVSTDITERKKMEEALAIEATRRLILIDQSSDGIVILDQNGKVHEANRRFAEMLGYSPEEILSLNVWDWEFLYTPEQVKEMIRTVDEAGDHFKTQHRRKDGTIYDVEISTNGAMFGGQKLIFCVCRDISERNRMEKALRESEEKFSLAFHSSSATIAITTLKEGRYVEVNESYARSVGYAVTELIGHTVTELNMWPKPDSRAKMLKMLKEQGSVNNEELEFRRKSGEIRTWLFSAEPINIAGEPCIISVSVDITDRKRAEEAVREREKRFSDIAGNAMEWIWEVDAKGKYTYSSPVVEKILGYTTEEILECHFYDFFLPEEREDLKKAAFEAFARREPLKEFLNRNRCKDGKTVDLLTSGVPVIDEEGNFLGYRGVDTDVTEKRKAEAALRESEEKFSLAFRSSPATIAINTYQEGRFVDVNESYANSMGYTREELIGRTARDFNIWVKPEDRARVFRILDEQGRVSNEEIDFRKKSGDIRTWLFSAEKIAVTGEPCLIGVSIDITERKKTEGELKEAMANLEQSSSQLAATNKELEAFSYSVSHDLRSPLRSIDGFSQALMEDYGEKLNATGQDYLNRLRSASQKMGELIDAILKLSRLTRSEMHHEKTDLSTLAGEIASQLQETQPKRKVKFVIDKDLTANGDPQLLRVLLENLLGNAWKFTGKKPEARIEFSMDRNNGKKAYFIRDNGAGFDMAYSHKLFGAFQRLHEATEFPGTGIGLATVQRIINRHGGAIWAEGNVGKGATFHFTLD